MLVRNVPEDTPGQWTLSTVDSYCGSWRGEGDQDRPALPWL